MPYGWASVSTNCSGKRPHETPQHRAPRVLPLPWCGRSADLQIPPVLLRVRLARLPRVRADPRDGEGRLAASALQPVEPRRCRLPRRPAVIVAGILSPIENALAWLLEHLHDSVGLSWGWSIVALTIIVRVALVPIMVKQIHSMQRMQAHLPEMKAIQQKYKGDRQRLNEELMKFYKEKEINPAASCLPMLVQIPVFFALYFVLRNFSNHVTAPSS